MVTSTAPDTLQFAPERPQTGSQIEPGKQLSALTDRAGEAGAGLVRTRTDVNGWFEVPYIVQQTRAGIAVAHVQTPRRGLPGGQMQPVLFSLTTVPAG